MVSRDVRIRILQNGRLLAERTLTPGEYIVGGCGADIVVEDESVATRHAKLIITSHEIFVQTLGPATFVNGQPVKNRTRIFPSQMLRIGQSIVIELRRSHGVPDAEESLTPQSAALARLLPDALRGERRHEIGDLVEEGGMGAILSARELGLDRTVAMKVMRESGTETSLARFVNEARLTGQLEHPNIVPVHEFGVDENDQPYYTMKFVRGSTLKKVLAAIGTGDTAMLQRHPLAQLITVFQKVCDAMAFAHSKGVVHRDLKPENIMLGEYGEVLVMDWGLAKRTGHEPDLAVAGGAHRVAHAARTLDGECIGTPHYMSPEQARGERVDARSDIYALGAILHSVLHLRPPVSGSTIAEVLENVITGRIESAPAGFLPHLPGGHAPASLAAVAQRAMSLLPVERYADVGALQAEITAYQGGFATTAENAGIWKLIGLALNRYRREARVLVLSLALLAAGAIYAFVKVARERTKAESALGELRGSAPVFAGQARSLAAQERFAEAVEKLDFALRLRPQAAELFLAKADLLECQFRFAEAAKFYREAEALQPGRAGRNAELCAQLHLATQDGSRLSREDLARLFASMQQDQRPAAEMLPVARLLGEERRIAFGVWKERLRELPISPDPPIEQRLVALDDGLLGLDLSGTMISDLQPLAGMPLAELNLTRCMKVENIAPLRELPLRKLVLNGTGVSDLEPLHLSRLESLSIKATPVTNLIPLQKLPLKSLDCSDIPARDFSPLAGLPLESLILTGTRVRELGFLRGMPLRTLGFAGCNDVRGIEVLSTLGLLETVALPEKFLDLPTPELAAIQALRGHRSIRQLGAESAEGKLNFFVGPKEAFWELWEHELHWIIRLKSDGLRPVLTRLPDGTWEVELREQPVDNLASLEGAPISKLGLFNTSISDLRPLADLPLTVLDVRCTGVTDLSPIRRMPLRKLLLWKTKIGDFTPIANFTDLELLDVAETEFSDLRLIKSRRLLELRIGKTRVTDLSPLEGLALEKLHADDIAVTDLRPLLKCPNLRWVIPPEFSDVTPLRQLRSLERLSFLWNAESRPSMAAAEFWQDFDQRKPTPKK